MVRVTCCLLLIAALAAAMPSDDRPSDSKEKVVLEGREDLTRETFDNGFTDIFSRNLPTKEFMGDFARRYKRQVGVTSAIDNILSSPYGASHATNHLQALLLRNVNVRPPRQSAESSRPTSPQSSPSFSEAFSPPSGTSSPQRFQSQSFRPQRHTAPSSLSHAQPHPLNRPPNFQVIHKPLIQLSPAPPSFSQPPPQSSSSPSFSHPPPQSSSSPSFSHPPPQSSSSPSFSHPPPQSSSSPSFSHLPPQSSSFSRPPPQFSPSPSFSHPPPQSSSSPSFSRPPPQSSSLPSFSRPPPQSSSFSRPPPQSSSFSRPPPQSSTFSHPPPQSSFSPSFSHSLPQFSSSPSFSRPPPQSSHQSPSGRERPIPTQEPFSSTSFTGQQFSSKFTDLDPFFESARLTRKRRDVTARQDVSTRLTEIIDTPWEDAEEAREDSLGFMRGKPDNFPGFHTIGGFGPMGELEKGNVAGTFMEEFKIPSVAIPVIQENQPQFSPHRFSQQTLDNENPHNENQHGVYDESKISKTRVRRRAGEPDTSDPANIPHKRVHRVQVDSQVPHSRNPREFQTVHDSETAYSEVPLQFEPFPSFNYPDFQAQRTSPLAGRGTHFGERSLLPVQYSKDFRVEADKVQVHTPDDDIIIPDGQRFYPTFNGRHGPPLPASQQLFFPSPPILPRAPGPRGGRLLPRGPAFRESPSQREQSSFRDFHNSFHSPGGREAIHKPEFSFPSSRHPFHREHEQGNFDNSLLGSGNFEILRGGTFYDDDDPNGYHHEYDHLLDDGYIVFPDPHSASHSNNYVDDFFSNFRDFSEFAVRKSEEGESTFLGDGTYFGRGYASEQVNKVVGPELAPSSVLAKDSVLKINQEDTDMKTGRLNDPAANESKTSRNDNERHQHRQPKNIQEVLEDIDPRPSEYASSFLTVNEKDPMIAMF
ncbi:tight junction protein ZO-1-like isoform X2 [Homarus americanus]|uniref:tight junction protein ZO-1-like isoform X2 n=1 Tax=Homarus americanus TaxID=6706 RepID=UPI001C478EEC|nr:tight junction protein ZO-1-like isoform X2 [Homarus americanus]